MQIWPGQENGNIGTNGMMWCHLDDVSNLFIESIYFIIRAAARHVFHGEQKAKEQVNKACSGIVHDDDDALQFGTWALTHLWNKLYATFPT